MPDADGRRSLDVGTIPNPGEKECDSKSQAFVLFDVGRKGFGCKRSREAKRHGTAVPRSKQQPVAAHIQFRSNPWNIPRMMCVELLPLILDQHEVFLQRI